MLVHLQQFAVLIHHIQVSLLYDVANCLAWLTQHADCIRQNPPLHGLLCKSHMPQPAAAGSRLLSEFLAVTPLGPVKMHA